eukprot:GHVQ01014248.1.p1 GENE.GHVQ01014248.1~~GHVQ01014248.1.p1  ORF type:complete len:121 (-),score=23.94 GHVQ01014248.1:565-927(-)
MLPCVCVCLCVVVFVFSCVYLCFLLFEQQKTLLSEVSLSVRVCMCLNSSELVWNYGCVSVCMGLPMSEGVSLLVCRSVCVHVCGCACVLENNLCVLLLVCVYLNRWSQDVRSSGLDRMDG